MAKKFLDYIEGETVYTRSEFCKQIGYSNTSLYHAIKNGDVRLVKAPYKLQGFRDCIPQREVDRLIREGRIKPKTDL